MAAPATEPNSALTKLDALSTQLQQGLHYRLSSAPAESPRTSAVTEPRISSTKQQKLKPSPSRTSLMGNRLAEKTNMFSASLIRRATPVAQGEENKPPAGGSAAPELPSRPPPIVLRDFPPKIPLRSVSQPPPTTSGIHLVIPAVPPQLPVFPFFFAC